MLKLKDIVIVKNDKGDALVAAQSYDRVYLAFGPNDKIAERAVTVNGKNVRVTSDGKFTLDQTVGTVFMKQEPEATVSVHAPDELFQAAVAYLQAEKPKTNPFTALLSEGEYGFDLKARAAIRNGIAPSKPIDEDKTIEQAAKKLVALGYASDLSAAITMVRGLKAQAAPTA